MKQIIKTALKDTFDNLTRKLPNFKNNFHTISIMDVEPLRLVEFMKDNNIPSTAEFSGNDNGYDGYDDFVLLWTTQIPMEQKDKDKFIKDRFDRNAVTFIHQALIKEGYYKKSFDSVLYREFTKESLYNRYLSSDFETIVKYYSHNYFLTIK